MAPFIKVVHGEKSYYLQEDSQIINSYESGKSKSAHLKSEMGATSARLIREIYKVIVKLREKF